MKKILRWISFVPGSLLVALIVWFIASRPLWIQFPAFIMLLFLPLWTALVLGVIATILSYSAATVALLFTAYWIIPLVHDNLRGNKKPLR